VKRPLLAVGTTLVLAVGLSVPASAATANHHASCAGLAGASRGGDPGAQADVVLHVVTEALNEGQPPGALEFSDFARHHEQTAEVCLD
jgi:hypothetical protein